MGIGNNTNFAVPCKVSQLRAGTEESIIRKSVIKDCGTQLYNKLEILLKIP